MISTDGGSSGSHNEPRESNGAEGANTEDGIAALEDFYYVDGLAPRKVVEHIYRRYRRGHYFSYFGNVLFYLMPSRQRDMRREYEKHLFKAGDAEPHLFGLLNEILHLTVASQSRPMGRGYGLLSDHAGSAPKRRFDAADPQNQRRNCNVFVYGDSSFGQMDVAKHAVEYLSQSAHVIGLEPSGAMTEHITDVNDLLAMFGDYASHDSVYRNTQMTYKLNFDSDHKMTSISVVPNMATDISCTAVSSRFRSYLASRTEDAALRDVVVRPPTIFYALLRGSIQSNLRRWLATCKLTARDAKLILQMLPVHEESHHDWHLKTLERAIRILLKIGFSADEVQSIMQVLAAVLLFDTCTLLRDNYERDPQSGSSRSVSQVNSHRTDLSAKDSGGGSGRMSIRSDDPNASSRTATGRASQDGDGVINPKDILVFAADVLDIGFFRVPAKMLGSQEQLFRLELLSSESMAQLDNLSSALFVRLKVAIYRKINSFLDLKRGSAVQTTISIHCNAGSFPQSLHVDKHCDLELARRASEEVFVDKLITAAMQRSNASDGDLDMARRSRKAVAALSGVTGLLGKVVVIAHDKANGKGNKSSWQAANVATVEHSWHKVNYDISSIAQEEAQMFTIPSRVLRLFAYSKNKFIIDLLVSKRSLHNVSGACAGALSYMTFLDTTIADGDESHFIVCTSPTLARKLYSKHANQSDSARRSPDEDGQHKGDRPEAADDHQAEHEDEGDMTLLERALSTNVPMLKICVTQRDQSQVTLDISAALNAFLPLAYVALHCSAHRNIPLMDDKVTLMLLLHALNVPTSAYKISEKTVTLRRALCVKILARAFTYLTEVMGSVKLIQRWWFGYNVIRLKEKLARTVVRIQARVRERLFQEHVHTRAKARALSTDFIGLCVVLYHLKVSLLSSSQKTLQLLHSMEKRYHEKEYHHIQHAAAAYIQACWRGRVQRKRYDQMRVEQLEDFGAALVQSAIRRFLATAKLVQQKPTRDIAATAIQAAYRGYRARRQYEVLTGLKLALLSVVRKGSKLLSLGDHLKFVKERKRYNSTTMQMKKLIMMQTNLPPGFTKVQNMIRMYFVRKQYLHLRSAIEKVQALGMTKVARIKYLEKVKAATTIQRWWRGVRPPGVAPLSGNALYYLNMREYAAAAPLRELCNAVGMTLFHFRAYHDLRHVYPRSWAAEASGILDYLIQMQLTFIDTGNAECPRIVGLQFAVGAYHSLMLVSYTQGGSTALYSWGGAAVLEAETAPHPRTAGNRPGTGSTGGKPKRLHTQYLPKPLEFYTWDTTELVGLGRPQMVLVPRVEITSIACGNEFSLALDRSGRVYSWGTNVHGQCGQGHRLTYVWSPTMLPLREVTGAWCGEEHSVVRVSVGEYFVFGRAFGYAIYAPEDIKAHCQAIQRQRIVAVACGGTMTVLYTAELRYVLRVLGGSAAFAECYNLRGNIHSVCTNGRMICAVVDKVTEGGALGQQVLAWGHLRCFSKHFKEPLPNTALLVNAFCEMLEHPERRRPRRSLVKVDSHLAKSCSIAVPTPVNIAKRVLSVTCDHQQMLFTCLHGVVLGVQTFELIHDSPSDIRDSDGHGIRLSPQVTNARLEPALYQFAALEQSEAQVQLAYNRLSCSVGYVATPTPADQTLV
ncbi:IQ calmodulin-binding domain containing protein, putative [Babesia bigemina]|uniref:IQ calmodulin-binding domain containing protein, putative n=1 Tax=Babesia bigemina TaxID=5866 RepID=A0A061DAJ8_BABBI|nr:IQ calmodulin-binding domain containing protein, putative [Babesia bigemina]CDR97007.1 IQ calmodulin-binding domain containing protein, putative [Babesia bigemina]|eukprot:XP_012769193.1 IQ calmodulin-binding domain containing protein, putative [Babesia bigemina]